jgi:hypothetical protein
VIPAVGGLISGVIVFTFAPEAEGHGTDSVIASYHFRQGQIRPRVPLVKIIASSITLGTGGSGGREGPIAQIGADFGSLLGNMFRLRPAERRVPITMARLGVSPNRPTARWLQDDRPKTGRRSWHAAPRAGTQPSIGTRPAARWIGGKTTRGGRGLTFRETNLIRSGRRGRKNFATRTAEMHGNHSSR